MVRNTSVYDPAEDLMSAEAIAIFLTYSAIAASYSVLAIPQIMAAGEERAQPAQEERRPRHQARRQVVRHGEVAGAEDDRRKRAREHLEAGHGPPS